jgi:plastocyanin
MRRLSIAAAATAALLALAACSSSSSGNTGGSTTGGAGAGSMAAGQSSAPSSAPKITIKDFGYTGDLTVKAGAKVTVVNEDSVAHTLTDKKAHKFDTGTIAGNGASGTFTAPSAPGKYPFGCTFHPEMAGTLTVTS